MMLDVERYEKKYLVDPVQSESIKRRLEPFLRADPHNGVNGYIVRSLYFDSISDTDFEDKLDGLDNRKKIRLRVYSSDAQQVKLECKQKSGGYQRKRSIELTKQDAQILLSGDYSILRNRPESLATELWYLMTTHVYRPKVIVEYDRYAMLSEDNNTRITFDSNLRATESSIDLFSQSLFLYPVVPPGNITLEVKYDHFLLSNVKRALSTDAGLQQSISKYVQARYISKHGRR